MATVPRATTQVTPAGSAPVYQSLAGASIGAFGGNSAGLIQAGKDLGRVSDQVTEAVLRERIEDNERQAKNLDIEHSKSLRVILLGDGTAENTGYRSAQGENAVTGYVDTTKAIDKARVDLLSRASNDRVKEMFGLSSAARSEDALGQIDAHREQQRKVAANTTAAARIQEASDDAAANPNDPRILMRSAAVIRAETNDAAERNGWSPSARESARQAEETKMYRAAIFAVLPSDSAAAQKIYDTHKVSIDGTARGEIERALEVGVVRQQSQDQTARIQSLHPGSLEAQIEAAKKILDPKVQDETIQRLDRDYARAERIAVDADRKMKKEAWEVITTPGGSVDSLTPQQLAILDGPTQSAMRLFEQRRAKDGSGYAIVSDVDTKNVLHELFMGDKGAFAKEDLNKFRTKLTEDEYNYWQGQQRQVDTRSERQVRKEGSYALANTLANEAMKAGGVNVAKTSGAKAASVLRDSVRDVVDKLYEGDNRPTKAEERDAIETELKRLFLSGEVDGSGLFSDSGKIFQFTPDQRKNFVLKDIPGQREEIASVLKIPAESVDSVAAALVRAKLPLTLDNMKALHDQAMKAANGR